MRCSEGKCKKSNMHCLNNFMFSVAFYHRTQTREMGGHSGRPSPPWRHLEAASLRGCSAHTACALNLGNTACRRRHRRRCEQRCFRAAQMKNLLHLHATGFQKEWSERWDSNSRPSAPKADALPGCATLRLSRYCIASQALPKTKMITLATLNPGGFRRGARKTKNLLHLRATGF